MPQTQKSALSQVLTFTVQDKVLENLRAQLVYGNRAWAETGRFIEGADAIKFASVPDLALATTPLTEGTPPASTSLTTSAVSVTALQYGGLVDISDLTKVHSPMDIVNIGSERLSRQATETIDQLVRDVIAGGGTAFYAGAVANRAALAATNKLAAVDLAKLRATMFKNKIPMFPDGSYRLIVSPEQGYDLRTDSTSANRFLEVRKYASPEPIIRGEIGMLEGFRIVEAVNAPTFASTVTVHAAIAMGGLPGWGWGDLQSLRTSHVAPGGDHTDPLGQSELLGWKVAFGTAVLANNRYYRAESAATAL